MSANVQVSDAGDDRRSPRNGGGVRSRQERTLDGVPCFVPARFELALLERTPMQLSRDMARMLLNGDFIFCAPLISNELSWQK